jgi:hypothetical protein
MTRTPRSSTKRIAPAQAAKKLSSAAKKSSKPVKKRFSQVQKVKKEAKMFTTKLAVPIEVDRTDIEYDAELAKNKGYLKISDGTPQLQPPHGDTLLHLLFFLIYTKEGADLLKKYRPTTTATPALAKANLKAALLQLFPTIEDGRPDSVLDPVIDAHFAADWYVHAVNAKNATDQAAYQALYSLKLLAILGELHDDAMAHEFSMLW